MLSPTIVAFPVRFCFAKPRKLPANDDGSDWATAREFWRCANPYKAVSFPLHLIWEFSHMPLYALWQTASSGRILFNGFHCTVGDLMIAGSTLLIAFLAFGRGKWPSRRWLAVASCAIVAGVGYTAFSEWHNVYVLGSWAYAPRMPMVPGTGVGLKPIAQWFLVPALAFWMTHRILRTWNKRPGF